MQEDSQDDPPDSEIEEVAIDVTEHPINRPKDHKEQEERYSGKKKRHTKKSQIIGDAKTHLIYDVDEAPGSEHDFTICKTTLLFVMVLAVIIFADSGYQGIQNYHEFSLIPIKKSKKKGIDGGRKGVQYGTVSSADFH